PPNVKIVSPAALSASSIACPRRWVRIVSSSNARPSSRSTAHTRSSVTELAFGLTISVARTRQPYFPTRAADAGLAGVGRNRRLSSSGKRVHGANRLLPPCLDHEGLR